MSINPRSVEFHQCHAKPHSICFFYHIIKDNERNLCQDLLTIENIDSIGLESARAALCQWATSTRQTFLSKTFVKSLNIQKQYEKNVWEKSNDAYSLSIWVQTTINHISIFTFLCFLMAISTSKKMFSFRARAEKGIARHIDASSVVGIWQFLIGSFWPCACKLSWTLLSPARVQPLYGVGRK